MITVARRVGRLVEARFAHEMSVADVKAFSTSLAQIVVEAGTRLVFAVDFRDCAPFDSTIEAMFLGQIRSDNWAIERSSFLFRPGTAVGATMEKLIALGKNPARKAFGTVDSLVEWLHPVVNAEELKRVKAFFAEMEVPADPVR
jgi:hypothetical protein